uniref:Uncharacterized protein n=1 Tax=Anguilla anguilla TaxID=7936 RepID=A0A0E9VR91_ANGAN
MQPLGLEYIGAVCYDTTADMALMCHRRRTHTLHRTSWLLF